MFVATVVLSWAIIALQTAADFVVAGVVHARVEWVPTFVIVATLITVRNAYKTMVNRDDVPPSFTPTDAACIASAVVAVVPSRGVSTAADVLAICHTAMSLLPFAWLAVTYCWPWERVVPLVFEAVPARARVVVAA
jgi:hypothetical protein